MSNGPPLSCEQIAFGRRRPVDELTRRDVASHCDHAFFHVVAVWEMAGAVRDGRLTPLGHWGLREAAARAFLPAE